MFYVSSRQGLENEDRVASTETVWELIVAAGGKTRRRESAWTELEHELSGGRVLMLVHGYNNDLEDVVGAYDIIERKCRTHLAEYYHKVIGYTWPGSDEPWEWYSAKRRSSVVAPRLASVIRKLGPHALSLDLMTHSLGSRVALKAIDGLDEGAVRMLCLLASAVDNESIERGGEFYASTQKCQRVFVFHSMHDAVLKYAYAAAEWDVALGLAGPEDTASIRQHSPNVTVVNCDDKIQAHGQYKYSDDLYRLMASALAGAPMDQFVTL